MKQGRVRGMLKLTNPVLAFVLGRLLLNVNFRTHSLVRLPKLAAFQAEMVKQLAAAPLPEALVKLFASVLPFAEGGIGRLLELFTRPAFAAVMLLMTSLVFGSSLLKQ